MATTKSKLFNAIWRSCNELRGGMDVSQYKDYVLVLLFIRYVSDKYAGVPQAAVTVPKGTSFQDMVALKGTSDIGEQINKKIIVPLARANKLEGLPDFNDATKLGRGKEMVDRLTNLITIFEDKALNFSQHTGGGDDILGDAYEYLLRHFATESGKSKGQFYTPAEVSRVMARILGITHPKNSRTATVYDPNCGSGSLLLKVGDEAGTLVTLYGQEKDVATSNLARMNLILHNYSTAQIVQGNTLADPKFKEGDSLKTFDYVVANPPFSDKRWTVGLDPLHDPFDRFQQFGTPPNRQGDYAYLLHIIHSLKRTGKAACILPHGVLFRRYAEAEIRCKLVKAGYIQGIIGLPANLFYGTGVAACIVVIDKQGARARQEIFMMDASAGFRKEVPKNRLRAQDIHRIVDVYSKRLEIPHCSRMVSMAEIERNGFNLNLPRYIDSQLATDRQDLEGHLQGGIPAADIEALRAYWTVCPKLRRKLFKRIRPGYFALAVDNTAIKLTIDKHPEFEAYRQKMDSHFVAWRNKSASQLRKLKAGCDPKKTLAALAKDLLAHYAGMPLINPYDVYQHLMDYWEETMQDDCELIAIEGWNAKNSLVESRNGTTKVNGWTCDLVPKALVLARCFAREKAAVERLKAESESIAARLAEIVEEHGGEDGVLAELDKLNRAHVTARLKEITRDRESDPEADVLGEWLQLSKEEARLKRRLKDAESDLIAKAHLQYAKFTPAEIKTLVVHDKWLGTLAVAIQAEVDKVSQLLSQRVTELAQRYDTSLPQMVRQAARLQSKVRAHLKRMGCTWR